jgi:hypothetical protein
MFSGLRILSMSGANVFAEADPGLDLPNFSKHFYLAEFAGTQTFI